ncbi:hypothetical protein TGFOU_364980 [Toxoplasma gondii FOU]|nr:hypothetical protein TGFOU_364980 [Toxoplasma gondii FOU]
MQKEGGAVGGAAVEDSAIATQTDSVTVVSRNGQTEKENGAEEQDGRQTPSKTSKQERTEGNEEHSRFGEAGPDTGDDLGRVSTHWRTPASLAGLLRERRERSDLRRD